MARSEGRPDITAPEDRTDDARSVLILEDDFLSGVMLADSVRVRGYAVRGPFHAMKEAMDALTEGAPDAALLDVSLGPDGTSRRLADALAERGVPFAFITGYGPETASVVAAHPGSLVIPKPIDQDTIGVLLAELLPQSSEA